MQEISFSKTIPSASTSGFLGHLNEYELQQKVSDVRLDPDGAPKSYGRIHVVCGPMFAQKRAFLLQKMRNDMASSIIRSLLIVTYEKDSQYYFDQIPKFRWEVLTRIKCKNLREILSYYAKYDAVIIEEAQFYTDIAPICDKLANEGKKVYVAACDGTFKRTPFGKVHELLPLAETFEKLSSKCTYCSREAAYTWRIFANDEDDEVEIPGRKEIYRATCRKCYMEQKELIKNWEKVLDFESVQTSGIVENTDEVLGGVADLPSKNV